MEQVKSFKSHLKERLSRHKNRSHKENFGFVDPQWSPSWEVPKTAKPVHNPYLRRPQTARPKTENFLKMIPKKPNPTRKVRVLKVARLDQKGLVALNLLIKLGYLPDQSFYTWEAWKQQKRTAVKATHPDLNTEVGFKDLFQQVFEAFNALNEHFIEEDAVEVK